MLVRSPAALSSRPTLVIALACSMVLLAGCHSKPQLDVVSHSWGERTDGADRSPRRPMQLLRLGEPCHTRLELNITLSNPAEADESRAGSSNTVRVMEIHYNVALHGGTVYEGRRNARMTLAPGDARTIVLPVIMPPGPPRPAGEGPAEQMPYRLTGTVLYLTDDRLSEILADLGFGYQRTSFALEGELAQARSDGATKGR